MMEQTDEHVRPVADGHATLTVQPSAAAHPRRRSVAVYVALTKPRIIELLLVTTIPAMFVAARGVPSLWLMVATTVGGAAAAGSANAINCWVDRDIDALMARTAHRPLVRSEVPTRSALRFGVGLGVIAFVWLAVTVNMLAAVLAIAANLFYVLVYTMGLKRRTAQNIVIGGAAGCVPVLVGWAAVTGTIELPALLLFAIVFAWTPPHFWALALRYRRDYERAGIPMLPVVMGVAETTRQILLYTVLLVAVSLMFGAVAELGLLYLVSAIALGAGYIVSSFRLWRSPDATAAHASFRYSITYIALLFGAMAVDVAIPSGAALL
ncbi:MAG TPA: heme o synthase [Euzebyales bacterium]|nr:heme o synthase [Euzebyales bacterium]